ncbi:DUF5802 family protein [Natronococcus wangiae]|uniref:DUF5802 family protein n=1 Tax=Natronococcus wangiae TaxID=3068275 RepID=UPI00273DB322|nr:DUF5802 family protein [Natronococcus sp. AD5]
MFEEFSAGYYIGRLRVAAYDGEHAVMERTQHEAANEQVYDVGDGIGRSDQPLLVKVDERHFPVLGADDVPSGTLAVPDGVLEATRVDEPPTMRAVLVAKADRATQFLEWFTPYTVNEPDYA